MSESDVDVVALGGGRYHVVEGDRRRLAYAVRSGRVTWVFLDGAAWRLDDTAAATRRATGVDEHSLAAPMPATVVAINTQPGATVARGDVLVMLEAMKMELPIRAPRDGRVTAVACTVGQLVEAGVPLVEME